MKVSCLVPVRNKAFFVGHTIKSTLDQTYPCEILLSDQGSTDGSLDILKYHQSAYRGPHKVRLLQCPVTEPKGMSGFNAHIHWMMGQTDADLIIIVSADDLNHPDRVKRTVEEYQMHRPSFIGTKMQFLTPPADGSLKMEVEGITAFDPKGSRFITAREHIEQLVGGSVSTAWDREFYEKIGGLSRHMIPDVYLPFLATLDRGFYMIDEQLFAYIRHPGEGNTGIGGRMLAVEQDGEMLFLNELANYQIVSTYYEAGRVAVRTFPEAWEGSDASEALYQNIVHRTNDWVLCRDYMNVKGQHPRVL